MPEPTDARVLFAGRYLSVVSETWPGIGEWEVLRKYPASAIVPLTPNGDVVLIRQFRIPVRQELLEVPAGLLDVPGEDALTWAGGVRDARAPLALLLAAAHASSA